MNSGIRPAAAVIGTGFIAAVHVDALRRIGVKIAGVLGSSPSRSQEGAARFGADKSYAALEELLDDPDVDVVHITSPNDAHAEQAAACLRAGKHVICEKPLALSSKETSGLRELARETGLVAAVNFNIRYYPQVMEMRERISSGDLGSPYLVTGSYRQDWLLYDTDWNWRAESGRGGPLRVVGDIGSHWFDLAAFVTGTRIVEVLADLSTFVPVRQRPDGSVRTFEDAGGSADPSNASGRSSTPVDVESEDAATILLRFEDGARGTFVGSQVSAGRKNAIEIEVNAATASVAWKGERPDELWIGHRSAPNELLIRDPSLLGADARRAATLPGGHAEGFENAFRAMYEDVYEDIARGRPSPHPRYATFEDGHDESLILDAVARSAETGQWTIVERDD